MTNVKDRRESAQIVGLLMEIDGRKIKALGR